MNYEDGTDVGRAMVICDRHTHMPSLVYPEGGTPLEYDTGWEDCYKVRQKWDVSATAKTYREQKEQEERDRVFIKSVAEEP
jgi:hypothetical protein